MSKKIAITLGDPAGIGPEVVLKAVNSLLDTPNSELRTLNSELVLIGSEHIIKKTARELGLLDRFITAKNISVMNTADELASSVETGKPSVASARSAIAYIDRAVELAMAGEVEAIATAPVSKKHITDAGIKFTGHTGYIAAKCGAANPVMMFALPAKNIFVALVTTHIRLSDVPRTVTREAVLSTIRTAVAGMQKYFRINAPKVAVLGLNPHAGEGGLLGDEEVKEILPAIGTARKDGINCDGPFAADGFFRRLRESPANSQPATLPASIKINSSGIPITRDNSQLIIAMYHDQGLVGVKALGEAVNITLGLPFLRTSCDHGTAFDIAGRGIANENSMRQAIEVTA